MIPLDVKSPMILSTEMNYISVTHILPVDSVLSLLVWYKHILSLYSVPLKVKLPNSIVSYFGKD